jgi:hypothetical protein
MSHDSLGRAPHRAPIESDAPLLGAGPPQAERGRGRLGVGLPREPRPRRVRDDDWQHGGGAALLQARGQGSALGGRGVKTRCAPLLRTGASASSAWVVALRRARAVRLLIVCATQRGEGVEPLHAPRRDIGTARAAWGMPRGIAGAARSRASAGGASAALRGPLCDSAACDAAAAVGMRGHPAASDWATQVELRRGIALVKRGRQQCRATRPPQKCFAASSARSQENVSRRSLRGATAARHVNDVVVLGGWGAALRRPRPCRQGDMCPRWILSNYGKCFKSISSQGLPVRATACLSKKEKALVIQRHGVSVDCTCTGSLLQ